MKDTQYAFAVARVRANEPSLLGSGELEQLISARDTEEVLRLLEEKGWDTAGAKEDPNRMLELETEKTWELLQSAAPEPEELSFLLARNDFHNGKAALKALVTGQGLAPYLLFPSTVTAEELSEAVSTRSFGKLPKDMAGAMEEAYGVLVETMDAQLADVILDRAALESTLRRARDTGNPTARRVAELLIVTSDIKIALRGAIAGKGPEFFSRALCESGELNTVALSGAAVQGYEELLAYLMDTPYSAAAEAVKQSFAAFEKWCDDLLLQELELAKRVSFGLEPLIAFYMAREAELKTVRILLSCKKLGIPPEEIKERVRRLYV